ncbi:MAG: hypothetical protein JSV92_04465 [archaeon]|nr:MAG: hypothetical protein JSV92_04465 [archaeon]
MKIAIALFLFLMIPTISVAQVTEMEKYEEIEGTYNIQTLVTRDNAYIILDTEKPSECEYDLKEFEYGEGRDFEDINGTLHKAKISIIEGESYRFKIKCIVEGARGEENIMFSVSRVSFFLLERLEEMKDDTIKFREEKLKHEDKIDVSDLNQQIRELEIITENAEKAIKENDIEGLRLYVSEGIRKKSEIENTLVIKSLQIYILDSSRYVIASIILIYLLVYLTYSFFIPYFRVKKDLKKLEHKERDLINLRKNTEMLYFHRKIDQETFNKMVVKEQEEVIILRNKISDIKKREHELVKRVFEPKTIIEWSLKERIHLRNKLKGIWKRIKGIKIK